MRNLQEGDCCMEHRFLQQPRQKMEKNIKFEQNTPLWDNSLSIEERLDYLTGAMTLEKKYTV